MKMGYKGDGLIIMAVDILPTELPRDSSAYFSNLLKAFIPALASANLEGAFEDSGLPPELQRSVIAWRGELTPDYQYIAEHMKANI